MPDFDLAKTLKELSNTLPAGNAARPKTLNGSRAFLLVRTTLDRYRPIRSKERSALFA